LIRQRAIYHRIDYAEQGAVRADAQAQGQKHCHQKAGMSTEATRDVSDVAPQCLQTKKGAHRSSPRNFLCGQVSNFNQMPSLLGTPWV
jgi:hypothetical protein